MEIKANFLKPIATEIEKALAHDDIGFVLASLDKIIRHGVELKKDDGTKFTVKGPTLSILNLINEKASHLKDEKKQTAVKDAIAKQIKNLNYKQASINPKLLTPELLPQLNQSLQELSKSLDPGTEGQTNAQVEVLNFFLNMIIQKAGADAGPEEVMKLMNSHAELAKQLGLTKKGIEEITLELDFAELFANAKKATEGISSEEALNQIVIAYKNIDVTNFDEQAAIEGFKKNESMLNVEQLKEIKQILADFAEHKDKAKLEAAIAKLKTNEAKAFCKYALQCGIQSNNQFDIQGLFKQLANFMPSILGSGLIGFILSSVLGVSASWGVVGSLAMAALGATAPNSETNITRPAPPAISSKITESQKLAAV